MHDMSISINTGQQKALSISQRVQHVQQPVSQKSDVANHLTEATQSVQVEISDQAKEKNLQDSIQQAHRKLMGKEQVENAEGTGEKKTLDEMIAELQEEIAQLSQEMAKLRAQADQKSMDEAKSLETQIAALTAQLMNLLTQKVEQEKRQ